MTFLRNLSHDLIDKKLWPLAVVLLAALVAVPVVLGGGDPEPASTAAPVPSPAATASSTPGAAEVAVAVEESALRRRDGAIRDPFKQQYVQKAVEAITGGAGPATSTPSPGPSTGSGGATTPSTGTGTGTGGGTGTTPSAPGAKPAPPKFDPYDVYRVSLRFGEPGGLKTKRDIPRLSPLPNAERPFFVFLGVLSGGKKAVFLVSSDAQATGDGTCRPSPTNCETVEMERGDTEFFDLETEDGVVQYQLDLISIRTRSDAPRAVAVTAGKDAKKQPAATSETRVVKEDGEADEEELGTDAYRWDAERGVLVRRKKASASMNVGGSLLRALRSASEDLVAADEAGWRSATP